MEVLYNFQAWHGRLRQRATRAEKLRFQALKADDQEAYMKEQLATLTNCFLFSINYV